MRAAEGSRAARLFVAAFLAGAALLVWSSVRGPAWAGPMHMSFSVHSS